MNLKSKAGSEKMTLRCSRENMSTERASSENAWWPPFSAGATRSNDRGSSIRYGSSLSPSSGGPFVCSGANIKEVA